MKIITGKNKLFYLIIGLPVIVIAFLLVGTIYLSRVGSASPEYAANTAKMETGGTGNQVVLKVGEKAPPINLTDQKGRPVKLGGLLKKDLTVVAFYPKDFSKVCTLEFMAFSRDYAKFAGLNVDIVGISVDSVKSHGSFASRYGMKFTLLSDKDATVSKAYGAYMPKMGMSARAYFVVDKAGVIRFAYVEKSPRERMDNAILLNVVKHILAVDKQKQAKA